MAHKRKRPGHYRTTGRCDEGGRGPGYTTLAVCTAAERQGFPDFTAINKAALRVLPALVARWLPDGRQQGREWVARNPRRVDRHPGSFRVNLRTGRWADFALADVRGGDPVSLAAYLSGQSQSDAARALADMLGGVAMSVGDGGKNMFDPLSGDERAMADKTSGKDYKFIEQLPKNHKGRYAYRNAKGRLLWVIQRYHIKDNTTGKIKKTFGNYMPADKKGRSGLG